MTRFFKLFIGAILLALVFNIGVVCAADGEETHADLNISKIVSSTGPYKIDDEVTWVVTVWNNGPGNATNITISEDSSLMTGLKNITAVARLGKYNTTTNIWNIDELKNASYTTLTLKTTFSTMGHKTNKVTITALNETDLIMNNNHAEATVQFNESDIIIPDSPVSANLVIKPTTLNLKSKGVFTVYVFLTGTSWRSRNEKTDKPRIDYANSSLTCSGAEMIRATVSNKEGGTLVAKFHRQDLENVTAGEGVRIHCSGTLVVNSKIIDVEGSDSIRVIGEQKGLGKFLSRLWKFLGISKDDVEITEGEDGNITVTFSLNPDNFKNPGQAKKILKIKDNEPYTETVNETAVSDQTRDGKENHSKNNGDNKQIRENNADDKPGKGNNGSNKRDDESMGKSTTNKE